MLSALQASDPALAKGPAGQPIGQSQRSAQPINGQSVSRAVGQSGSWSVVSGQSVSRSVGQWSANQRSVGQWSVVSRSVVSGQWSVGQWSAASRSLWTCRFPLLVQLPPCDYESYARWPCCWPCSGLCRSNRVRRTRSGRSRFSIPGMFTAATAHVGDRSTHLGDWLGEPVLRNSIRSVKVGMRCTWI